MRSPLVHRVHDITRPPPPRCSSLLGALLRLAGLLPGPVLPRCRSPRSGLSCVCCASSLVCLACSPFVYSFIAGLIPSLLSCLVLPLMALCHLDLPFLVFACFLLCLFCCFRSAFFFLPSLCFCLACFSLLCFVSPCLAWLGFGLLLFPLSWPISLCTFVWLYLALLRVTLP